MGREAMPQMGYPASSRPAPPGDSASGAGVTRHWFRKLVSVTRTRLSTLHIQSPSRCSRHQGLFQLVREELCAERYLTAVYATLHARVDKWPARRRGGAIVW